MFSFEVPLCLAAGSCNASSFSGNQQYMSFLHNCASAAHDSKQYTHSSQQLPLPPHLGRFVVEYLQEDTCFQQHLKKNKQGQFPASSPNSTRETSLLFSDSHLTPTSTRSGSQPRGIEGLFRDYCISALRVVAAPYSCSSYIT